MALTRKENKDMRVNIIQGFVKSSKSTALLIYLKIEFAPSFFNSLSAHYKYLPVLIFRAVKNGFVLFTKT